MIPITSLIGKGKAQITMDLVDIPRIAEYAAEDADATWRIEEILAPQVREAKLWDLYAELERPLIPILAAMETLGVKVDVKRLQALSAEFAAKIAAIEAEIYKEAGHPFNIGSLPQLRTVLFDELKLPSYKKTPGGDPSTDVEVLESLAAKHPLPRLLIEQRQLSKLKSTYLDALASLADDEGRVHASFNQVVTATGRLSRRATPTSRTSRSGPRPAARSARRSSPASPAGRWWRRTTRRSSCGSSPTTPRTPPWSAPSPRISTSTPPWPRGSSAWPRGPSTRTSAGWPRRSTSA